ncbi:MAG: hypothetical protein KBG11_06985 [Bacteroidia bacterium]|nr:hypothetical protein [Bacteroidia bacterium]
MKTTLITSAFITALLVVSCNQTIGDLAKDTANNKVLINYSIVTGINENQVVVDSIFEFANDSLELGLYSMKQWTTYIAFKEIEKNIALDNYKLIAMYLVDTSNTTIHFKDTAEFLNHMTKRGYQVKSQQKHKYYTNYTFAKR